MTTVCAWCEALGERIEVSHGICEACAERFLLDAGEGQLDPEWGPLEPPGEEGEE